MPRIRTYPFYLFHVISNVTGNSVACSTKNNTSYKHIILLFYTIEVINNYFEIMKHFFSLRPWILAAVVLASAGTTVAAQGKMEAYPANEKWFVSGSVGAGVYVGDYDMHTKFGNRISITGDVSGGKWITPVLGARLQISGMHASGEAMNGSSESWNFMMYHADIMVDVLNWWCGVDEERTYSLIPLVGGGVANAPGLNTTTGVLTVGVLNRFKVSEHLDINVEIKGNLVGDKLDGCASGKKGEGAAALTAGLTYNF